MHKIACRVSSSNFHKFSGEWLVELPPQISSPFYLGLGFALNSQALGVIGSGFVLNFPLRNFDLVAPRGNSPMAFAISNFFGGDTPNSSQVDGVRRRWEGGVGMGPHNCI